MSRFSSAYSSRSSSGWVRSQSRNRRWRRSHPLPARTDVGPRAGPVPLVHSRMNTRGRSSVGSSRIGTAGDEGRRATAREARARGPRPGCRSPASPPGRGRRSSRRARSASRARRARPGYGRPLPRTCRPPGSGSTMSSCAGSTPGVSPARRVARVPRRATTKPSNSDCCTGIVRRRVLRVPLDAEHPPRASRPRSAARARSPRRARPRSTPWRRDRLRRRSTPW